MDADTIVPVRCGEHGARADTTPPRLDDLHLRLAWELAWLARSYLAQSEGWALALVWGHRTLDEQIEAVDEGHSSLDPRRGAYSLHTYYPALAADLWLYEGVSEPALYEGRCPDGKLVLTGGKALRRYREQVEHLWPEALHWGGDWSTPDAPHWQLERPERLRLLQTLLAEQGHGPGDLDGVWGPATRAACQRAAESLGVDEWEASCGPLPVTPALWRSLHEAAGVV